MEFIESGMTFSFPDSDIFQIEKCPTYKSLNSSSKICECIVKQKEKNRLFIIEAKTSFSNPKTNDGKNFDENVNDIIQKILNSITLYYGLLLNRPYQMKSTLPKNLDFAAFSQRQYSIMPVLIISDFEEAWLPPVKDALNSCIKKYPFTKFLVLEDIQVLNRQMAKDRKLITD